MKSKETCWWNHISFSTISFLFGHRLFKKIRSGLMQATLIAAFFYVRVKTPHHCWKYFDHLPVFPKYYLIRKLLWNSKIVLSKHWYHQNQKISVINYQVFNAGDCHHVPRWKVRVGQHRDRNRSDIVICMNFWQRR